ncbi:MAG: abc transporter, atpase subunit [Herbinix sp.]|jgi:ABC-2 type transport system ATP-binding protein|nr:abc transporter, atpase subunit [Herbinix sp.]
MEYTEGGIIVTDLVKDYDYYVKEEGIRGSLKNLLRKEIKKKHAVRSISFEIPKGEIIGFIGPNGAGKTTTLKMLSGIICPTSGEINIDGYRPIDRKKAFKRNISIVMGQKSQLWWDLPAIESLNFNAYLYELNQKEYHKRLDEMCEMLQVKDLLHVQVRRLSLGERMKMELITAFIHNPQVIFLDEPTIGLDINSQQAIRDFLKQYNEKYRATITLTSHYMADITHLCERCLIINEGNIVYDGKLSGVNQKLANKKLLKLKFSSEFSISTLKQLGDIRKAEGSEIVLEVRKEEAAQVMAHIIQNYTISDFTMEDVPIEESISLLYKTDPIQETERGAG